MSRVKRGPVYRYCSANHFKSGAAYSVPVQVQVLLKTIIKLPVPVQVDLGLPVLRDTLLYRYPELATRSWLATKFAIVVHVVTSYIPVPVLYRYRYR